MRQLNIENEVARIVAFIQNKLKSTGFSKTIVGLSGGIDSALTASLCVKALGSQNVYGVMMPYKNSHPDSLGHASLLAQHLNISYQVVDISLMVDEYFKHYAPDADLLRKGNFMARIRMCTLFDLSAKHQAIVAGTSNKSELYVGYCTQYGDSACGFEPIGHLYKTEVRAMSEYLNIPGPIIKKKPTADLWAGQTDEEELGITYASLDEILYQLIDLKKSDQDILMGSVEKHQLELVHKKIRQSEFKRQMPDMME